MIHTGQQSPENQILVHFSTLTCLINFIRQKKLCFFFLEISTAITPFFRHIFLNGKSYFLGRPLLVIYISKYQETFIHLVCWTLQVMMCYVILLWFLCFQKEHGLKNLTTAKLLRLARMSDPQAEKNYFRNQLLQPILKVRVPDTPGSLQVREVS